MAKFKYHGSVGRFAQLKDVLPRAKRGEVKIRKEGRFFDIYVKTSPKKSKK